MLTLAFVQPVEAYHVNSFSLMHAKLWEALGNIVESEITFFELGSIVLVGTAEVASVGEKRLRFSFFFTFFPWKLH